MKALQPGPDLTLTEARAIMDRAIERTRRFKLAGTIVIMDLGANLVCLSRMSTSPASAWIARGKAYLTAARRVNLTETSIRWHERPFNNPNWARMVQEPVFPGEGGMLIRRDGRAIGAIATGEGIGPYDEIPGVDPGEFEHDGVRGNAEDVVIAYALGIPYTDQHTRTTDRPAREGPLRGRPGNECRDDLPHSLDVARRYADRALGLAQQQGFALGVAVVDETGLVMQMDRMDGAPPGSPDLAEARAATALVFQRPSLEVTRTTPPHRLARVNEIVHFQILDGGGGAPIVREGRIVGAVGVFGAISDVDADALARAAAAG
ncbi:MAG TPA: heme-binding protein [Chloroflexota bacterium]|nr:heme-binding protein [Chloroflexota bacterium]